MSGLFEHIAAFDEGTKIAHRKAVAVARKRVLDRVGGFLRNATDQDREARLALVNDDINDIVVEAVTEYGGELEHVNSAVREAINAGLEATPVVELQKEARRPKMCPYHSELVDSSLQVGEPQYGAFSGLVGGPSHCKGGFDGTCNFKPDMVSQSYWDGKQQEYDERRQQREQEALHPPINPVPEVGMPTPPEAEGQGITDINTELSEAPSAVADPVEPVAPEMSMAAGTVTSQKIRDGAVTTEKLRDGTVTVPKVADADRDGGGAVKTEKLPNKENDGPTGLGSEPSPKTDHTTWKPNALNDSGNIKPVDTEMDGSPHPTEEQDVFNDDPDWEGDFLRDTDAVTEQQTLPSADDSGQSTERNIEQPHTDTFGGEGQVDPVTSSADPDKNPIREILGAENWGPEQTPDENQLNADLNAEGEAEQLDSTGRPALTTTCANCSQPFSTRDARTGSPMGDVECPHCGTEQNSSGQLLAPRSQWGEETGESYSDIMNPRDPESLGWPYESSVNEALVEWDESQKES